MTPCEKLDYATTFVAAKEIVEMIKHYGELPDLRRAGLCYLISEGVKHPDAVYFTISNFVNDHIQCKYHDYLDNTGEWTDERIYGLLFLAEMKVEDFE